MTILYSVLVLGALGAAFGALLAFASKIFHVEVDPRQAAVRDALAGANCGGCGYPGCDGYAAAVAKGEAPCNKCVAGGAATAIEIQAALDGVKEISIFNIRDKFYEVGEETVRKINEKTNCKAQLLDLADHEALKGEIDSSVLLANATGCGMKPLEGMTWLPDKSYLRPDLIVTDTVYAPAETEFLRIAKEVGCKNMNGFGMMLFQGAAAFKLWTGVDMPIDHMKEVLGIRYGE